MEVCLLWIQLLWSALGLPQTCHFWWLMRPLPLWFPWPLLSSMQQWFCLSETLCSLSWLLLLASRRWYGGWCLQIILWSLPHIHQMIGVLCLLLRIRFENGKFRIWSRLQEIFQLHRIQNLDSKITYLNLMKYRLLFVRKSTEIMPRGDINWVVTWDYR